MSDKYKSGKEVFTEVILEVIDFLPVDWEKIDPEEPAPAPNEVIAPHEKIIGEMTEEQKVLWSVLQQIDDNVLLLENGTPVVGEHNASIELVKNVLFFHLNKSFGGYNGIFTSSGIKNNYKFVSTVDDSDFHLFMAQLFS